MSGTIDRRTLLGAGALALAELGCARGALAKGEAGGARELIGAAQELGGRLIAGKLAQAEWQDEMSKLFAQVDVARLADALDVERLLAKAPEVKRGARVVAIPPSALVPRRERMQCKLFAFERGRANPPHAHDNMVSMHLVLRGRFRVRHFERFEDSATHMIVVPTIDRIVEPGGETSISDQRDNVHWHRAETAGVLLDIVAANLDPAAPPTNTHLLDLDRAERLPLGRLRAPRLDSVDRALELYG